MNILILGAGQVGSSAAYDLTRSEANEVTVVDVDGDRLRELQDRLDIRTVRGHAAHPQVMTSAGGADADPDDRTDTIDPAERYRQQGREHLLRGAAAP